MREAARALGELLRMYKELKDMVTAPLQEAAKPVEEAFRNALTDVIYRQLTHLEPAREPAPVDLEELKKRIMAHFK